MAITYQDVEHVAKLARLELSSDEREQFTEQLNAILSYAEKLNELDTEQIPPTSHVLKLVNVMRDDITRPSLTIDQVMKNAPEQ